MVKKIKKKVYTPNKYTGRNLMNKGGKVKGVSMSGLTTRQQNAMTRHAEHHTAKHIKEMVKAMKKGSTFGESHKVAMKKVGK
jgi:hypothetical protein